MGTKKWTQNWGLSFVFLNGAPKMGTKNGTQNGNQKTSHLIQKKTPTWAPKMGPKQAPEKDQNGAQKRNSIYGETEHKCPCQDYSLCSIPYCK